MNRAVLTWLPFVLVLVVTEPGVWADRPGSYDGVISVHPPRAAGGRFGRHSGPLRHAHGWPRHAGFTSVYFGVGPAFAYPPPFPFPMYYPPVGYYGYGIPTGIYYNPAANHVEYYLPPTHAPAELAYGPLAVERFLGIRRGPLAPPPATIPRDAGPRDAGAGDVVKKLRKSNEAARQRARRFIDFGDAMFRRQRCHEAVQRYKSAITAAPDLADAYYRQGFALIAVNQYKMATRAFKIALELDPGIAHAGLRLDDLYGDHRLAKTAQLETLAQAALDRGGDGDLIFLVGMMLHADGEEARARKFFQKAAELAGPAATFLNTFLSPDRAPLAPDRAPEDKRAAALELET